MMIKRECRVVTRQLWDYTIGRLSEKDADRVEMHIARCAACRRELQSTKLTAGLVQSSRQQAEPESRATWHALRAQLEHEQKMAAAPAPPRSRPSTVLPVWAGTLMAGAFLATVWTTFQSPDPEDGSADLTMQKFRINSPAVTNPEIFIQEATPEPSGGMRQVANSEGPKFEEVSVRPPAAIRRTAPGFPGREASEEPGVPPVKREEGRKANVRPKPRKPATEKPAAKPEPVEMEPQREFVMGTIPGYSSRISPASMGSDSEEAPVW